MELPSFYIQEVDEVQSFHQLNSLVYYLCGNPNNIEQQKLINFEKSIFALSGNEIENFSIKTVDLAELDLYIQSKLDTQNEYLILLYELANIHLKFERKIDVANLSCLLDTWLKKLESLTANYSHDDNSNIILNFLNTYLILSKKLNKKYEEEISNVINFLITFNVSDEAYTVFCNQKLFTHFNKLQTEQLIGHFFNSLKDKSSSLNDKVKITLFNSDLYFMRFFKNALDICEKTQLHKLKNEIADFIIDNTLESLNLNFSIEDFKVYETLMFLLDISKYHSLPKEAKNIILLNIIEVSVNLHNNFKDSIVTYEQPVSEEFQNSLKKQISKFEKLSTLDYLAWLSHSFFDIAKLASNINHTESVFFNLPSQLLIDESGLIKGIVNDEESNKVSILMNHISNHIQLVLPLIQNLINRSDFNQTLFEIKMFGTGLKSMLR